jgi:hypothetical protein
LDHLNLLNMFLEMRVPSAAGILKVRSDKRKVYNNPYVNSVSDIHIYYSYQ